MNAEKFETLKQGSLQVDGVAAVEYLTDVMLLVERHTQDRYAEENFPSIRAEANGRIILTDQDVRELIYFLFYVLINCPDRAWAAAWALGKCYGHDIVEGLCQAIELYRYKDDTTCYYLIKAIADSHPMSEISSRVRDLFRDIADNGLPVSKEYANSLFNIPG